MTSSKFLFGQAGSRDRALNAYSVLHLRRWQKARLRTSSGLLPGTWLNTVQMGRDSEDSSVTRLGGVL